MNRKETHMTFEPSTDADRNAAVECFERLLQEDHELPLDASEREGLVREVESALDASNTGYVSPDQLRRTLEETLTTLQVISALSAAEADELRAQFDRALSPLEHEHVRRALEAADTASTARTA